jgi:hypothetical protein
MPVNAEIVGAIGLILLVTSVIVSVVFGTVTRKMGSDKIDEDQRR